jgi:hypothetical protein
MCLLLALRTQSWVLTLLHRQLLRCWQVHRSQRLAPTRPLQVLQSQTQGPRRRLQAAQQSQTAAWLLKTPQPRLPQLPMAAPAAS